MKLDQAILGKHLSLIAKAIFDAQNNDGCEEEDLDDYFADEGSMSKDRQLVEDVIADLEKGKDSLLKIVACGSEVSDWDIEGSDLGDYIESALNLQKEGYAVHIERDKEDSDIIIVFGVKL